MKNKPILHCLALTLVLVCPLSWAGHDQREIPAATRQQLISMGYTVEANSWGDLGNIQVIKIDGKKVSAAADRRGRGEARLID